MEKKKSFWRRLAAPLSIGFTLVLLCSMYFGVFGAGDRAELLKHLSDAFLIPSAVMIGIGGLSFVADKGFFDLLGYGTYNLFGVFIPQKDREERGRDFYEYKLKKAEKRGAWLSDFLVVGLLLLVISFILAKLR